MKNLQKGFSLIELLVVVAIIGILAAIGSVGYSKYIASAKGGAAKANAAQAASAIAACYTQGSCGTAQDTLIASIYSEVSALATDNTTAPGLPTATCSSTTEGIAAVAINSHGTVYYCDATAATPAWVQQGATGPK